MVLLSLLKWSSIYKVYFLVKKNKQKTKAQTLCPHAQRNLKPFPTCFKMSTSYQQTDKRNIYPSACDWGGTFLWRVSFSRLIGHFMETPNSARWLLRPHARLPSWPQQCHGALSESRSGGFSRRAFGWRSAHSFSGARLRSNGSMVDLSHERYLQWQQHKAPGAQKHLMPEEPFFPLARNRNNNAAKTCGGVIWCCCHRLLHTRVQVLKTVHLQYYGWGECRAQAPKPYVCSDRMSCQSTCVVMHFRRYNGSVGIFLLPKAFLGRLGPSPHTADVFSITLNYVRFPYKRGIQLVWWRKTGQVGGIFFKINDWRLLFLGGILINFN